MYYYFVWVRSNRYHGSDPLTYSSEQKLTTGSVVRVKLQRQVVMGVVSGVTTEPRFKTKPITEIVDIPPIPAPLLKTAQWLQAYYPAPLGIITQQLIPASLTEKRVKDAPTPLFDVPNLEGLPKLTPEANYRDW